MRCVSVVKRGFNNYIAIKRGKAFTPSRQENLHEYESVEAIGIQLNRKAILIGIGVFSSSNIMSISVFKGRNYYPQLLVNYNAVPILHITKNSLSAKSDTENACKGPCRRGRVLFESGIEMQENALYTIQIKKKIDIGELPSRIIINGKPSVTESDLRISFHTAAHSDHTNVSKGAIPFLYFLPDL